MTLIEGVGDEVIQFVGVVLVVIVAALAWWSTNARPDRYRTVLVMRSRTPHPVTVSIRTRPIPISSNQVNSSSQASADDGNSPETIDTTQRDSARVIPLQEMDSIVDADMAMMDNNRLHFYRRIDSPNTAVAVEDTSDENESQTELEPASTTQIREMDSIVNAMEADVTTSCDFFNRPNETTAESSVQNSVKTNDNNESNPSVSNVDTPENNLNEENAEAEQEDAANETEEDGNRRKILIKLKYLNDTQKEVEGSLDELLKDFKWRHFSSELSAQCRVRLFFKGRALSDEAATLSACGLYDRAVVHCLISPNRTAAHTQIYQQRGVAEDTSANAPHEIIAEGAPPERAWDLENILMTLVSVALTVVWFFRCEYSNMFTASASLALFGLTVFYSVAIFGLYLSDTFHFDRRPPQPVPNN